MPPVRVALLDVNETLSELGGLDARFTAAGLDPAQRTPWFARVLRDGISAAAAGTLVAFRDLALAHLRALGATDEGAEEVVEGFLHLDVHPDVGPGLRALRDAGITPVTLTNGSVAVTEALLERAGLLDLVERRLDVTGAGRWKPHPDSYAWALEQVGCPAGEAAMVACHPWDILGGQRAGMVGVFVERAAPWLPPYGDPHVHVASLDAVAPALQGVGA